MRDIDFAQPGVVSTSKAVPLWQRNISEIQDPIMAAGDVADFDERIAMRGFTAGLFDRLDETTEPPAGNRRDTRAQAVDDAMRSVTRDLQALLNTRCGLPPGAFTPHPAVSSSILNYGLIDFAGMCMNSDADQQEICKAVQLAIQRHEPRLHNVTVALQRARSSINRVEFVITAQLKNTSMPGALSFNAVFRPSLQQYSIEGAN